MNDLANILVGDAKGIGVRERYGHARWALKAILLLLVWLFSVPVFSGAASVEQGACRSPRLPVDRFVCADPTLRHLAENIEKRFRIRIAGAGAEERAGLREIYAGWLKFRMPECGESADAQIRPAESATLKKCLLQLYETGPEPQMARCQVNATETLADLIAKGVWVSTTVPHGFIITGGFQRFGLAAGVNRAQAYWLPSAGLVDHRNFAYGTGAATHSVAQCRARAPDGTEWLAVRHPGGFLSYLRAADTAPRAR
jgi:hypothetical protein